MKKLLNRFSLFFGTSKSEVRGMLLLISICLFALFVPLFQRMVYTSSPHELNIKIDTITIVYKKDALADFSKPEKGIYENNESLHLNPKVDVNKISFKDLQLLGVRKQICNNIAKYLEKGGRFYKQDDLNKVYGISDEEVQRIISNTVWENPIKAKEPFSLETHKKEKASPQKSDLNTVDSTTLERLNGIGSTLAKRIVKYREKLGGFIELNQLKEVYGINETALKELQDFCFIANNYKPKEIYINHINLELLAKHPYIGYKKSKVIVNYLKNHGKLVSVVDLKKSYPFTEAELEKLKPYISYE